MKLSGLSGLTLGIGLAAGFLDGCGGSGSTPLIAATQAKSSVSPGASRSDLLYVATPSNGVYVFKYPHIALVAKFQPGGLFHLAQLCSDAQGNVFITGQDAGSNHNYKVYEYAHGGTEPIGGFEPFAAITPIVSCAVDPATRNLAVVAGSDSVAVYDNEQGTPTIYTLAGANFGGASYDNDKNLFIEGGASTNLTRFSPSGYLQQISLNENLTVGPSLFWDGSNVVLEDINNGGILYQISVSGLNGTVTGEVDLKETPISSPEIWKYKGTILSLCCPAKGSPGGETVGFFKYPKGGIPHSKLPRKYIYSTYGISGFTISVPPSSK